MLTKSKVKYIQSLGQKKFREEHSLFIAEGPKLLHELLTDAKAAVQEIFALQEWVDENNGLIKSNPCTIISPAELEKISQLTTPNQVLAVVKQFEASSLPEVKDTITLALDDIRDPGNLGTIIRIADWFGITQIVCSKECADCYNPKVVQATMGSIARVKVCYTDIAGWLQSIESIPVYAAVLNGQDIASVNKTREGILLVGNESKGLRQELINAANVKITIPRKGKAESLNAAVATGIILSHLI